MQLVAKCFKYLNRVDNTNNYPVALRQAEAGQCGAASDSAGAERH